MFERLISLVGKDKFKKVQIAKVLVVGLGGVGGYAYEALIRSGIINITIVDGDVIEKSNLNRQIITSNSNIGLSKVLEAKNHGLSINPEANITAIDEFLTEDNFDVILKNNYDYVIDACDDIKVKYLLIKYSNKYKLVSSMGTANKMDPSKFSITDLDKTSYDPIAKKLRKMMKDNKLRRRFKVVSSTEAPTQSEVLGTNSYIPGIAGLLCASYVINSILKK